MNEPVYEFTEEAQTWLSRILLFHPNPIGLMSKVRAGKGMSGLTFLDTINILHYGYPLEVQPRERQVPCKNLACTNNTANLSGYCDHHYQLPPLLGVNR